MNRKLNVLYLASWYPSRMEPKLGNFIRRHAEAASREHRVCVISAIEAGFEDIEINEDENLFEIQVYFKKTIPLFSYYRAVKRGLEQARFYFSNIDLVHVHVAFPAGLAALRLDQPYIVTEHFSGYHPISKYKWTTTQKSLTKRILKKAEIVLPVSQFLEKAIKEFSPRVNSQVVPNVVNEALFYPEKYEGESFTFLHISTLEERSKNISGLLRGVKLFDQRGINYKLKIGGDGDLDELMQKIKNAGIPIDKIEIISEKPIEGIASLMRECHCLLMFSHFETQSCTILEALCSGRPVVSSKVGGIPEIINESNGILVEPGNPKALADGMEEMMENYGRYNGDEISQKARARYSYKAVGKQLSEIYLNVWKKAASGR